MALVEELRPIAEGKDISLAQLAIAWALRHTIVTAAIVGARREGQMLETSKATHVDFNREELENIESLLKKREKTLSGKEKAG